MVLSLSLFKQETIAGITTKVVSLHIEMNVAITDLTSLHRCEEYNALAAWNQSGT